MQSPAEKIKNYILLRCPLIGQRQKLERDANLLYIIAFSRPVTEQEKKILTIIKHQAEYIKEKVHEIKNILLSSEFENLVETHLDLITTRNLRMSSFQSGKDVIKGIRRITINEFIQAGSRNCDEFIIKFSKIIQEIDKDPDSNTTLNIVSLSVTVFSSFWKNESMLFDLFMAPTITSKDSSGNITTETPFYYNIFSIQLKTTICELGRIAHSTTENILNWTKERDTRGGSTMDAITSLLSYKVARHTALITVLGIVVSIFAARCDQKHDIFNIDKKCPNIITNPFPGHSEGQDKINKGPYDNLNVI